MYGLKFNWLTGDMSDLELANQRLNKINNDISSWAKYKEVVMLEYTRLLSERRKLKVDHANFLKSVAVNIAEKASLHEELVRLQNEEDALKEKISSAQFLAKNDGLESEESALESKVSAEQVEECVSMAKEIEQEQQSNMNCSTQGKQYNIKQLFSDSK